MSRKKRPNDATNFEIRTAVLKGLKNCITNMETYDLILEAASDRMVELQELESVKDLREAVAILEKALPKVRRAFHRIKSVKKETDGSHEYATLGDGDPEGLLPGREVLDEARTRQRLAHQSAPERKRGRPRKAERG